jgi:gentisate 1,2-dioxygenase
MAEVATAGQHSFVAALEASHLHPLWDRYQRITPIKPAPKDAPFHWRWRDIEARRSASRPVPTVPPPSSMADAAR